ncbi:hypothetical protein TRVL_05744 [Trypanosoma vivax]|nr:hypothetical protein TRVL_05744 [Trypanosoma vivax]
MVSFRPVTLTSTLCKLMERIVARGVRDCIEDKLQPQQAGFRPARSTLDTLMQVTSALRRRMARRRRRCSLTMRVPSIPWITAALSRSCCPLALKGIWLRGSRAFFRSAGEGERRAVGGYQPHLWCPSGLGAGTAAVHCHGGFAEQAAQLHPWAAAWFRPGEPHSCVRER